MGVLKNQVTDDALISVRTDRKVHLLGQYGPFGILERREWSSMQVSLFRKI
jgi:hypothetical protein